MVTEVPRQITEKDWIDTARKRRNDPDGFIMDIAMPEIRTAAIPKESEENFSLGEKILNAQISLHNLRRLSKADRLAHSEVRSVQDLTRDISSDFLGSFEESLRGAKGKGTKSKNKDTVEAWEKTKEITQNRFERVIEELRENRSDFFEREFNTIRDGVHAYKRIIEGNLLFAVRFILWKYEGRGVALPDLIQEASIGISEAAVRYNYLSEIKFTTFARNWIEKQLRLFTKKNSLIRLPENVWRKRNLLSKKDANEAKTVDDMDLEKAFSLLEIASLDQALEDDKKLSDQLPSQESTEEKVILEDVRRAIRRVLKEFLSEDEEKVLALEFGLDDDKQRTLREIGDEMGYSRTTALNYKKSAIEKLLKDKEVRARLEELRLESYRLNFPFLR